MTARISKQLMHRGQAKRERSNWQQANAIAVKRDMIVIILTIWLKNIKKVKELILY
jgi:hypothetical protein